MKLLLIFSIFIFTFASGHEYVHPLKIFSDVLPSIEIDLKPDVIISTNCSQFYEPGQYCNVTWSGVTNPTESDAIGLYVPADGDPTGSVPVQYALAVKMSQSHLLHGCGWAVFRLINMRQSFGFKLIQNGMQKPRIIAVTQPIPNIIPNQPTEGHLTIMQDSSSVAVQWISGGSDAQHVQYSVVVREQAVPVPKEKVLRERLGIYEWSVKAVSTTYSAGDLCGYPAMTVGWLDPGFIHTAVVSFEGIAAGSLINYRYGSEEAGWSAPRSFIVPPRPGVRPDPPVRFLAFNDIAMSNSLLFNSKCPPYCPAGLNFNENYGRNSTKLPKYLEQEEAHLALLIGDLAYAMGYGADWDYFGEQFESAFTRWPLAVAMGNHERDWPGTGDAFLDMSSDSGGECGVPTSARYRVNSSNSSEATYAGATAHIYSSSSDIGLDIREINSGVRVHAATGGRSRFLLSEQHSLSSILRQHSEGGSKGGGSKGGGSKGGGSKGRSSSFNYVERHQKKTEQVMKGAKALFYSFDRGSVHFIIMDSEMPSGLDSPQGRWVAKDLSYVDRTSTPWVVVGMHRMMWAPATWRQPVLGDLDNEERLQGDLEELFMNHEVDVVIHGHEHAYARSCMLYKGQCLDEGPEGQRLQNSGWRAPVYLLAGHAGAGFTHGFPSALPEWVKAGYQERNGYLRFEADFNALRMWAISSDDGTVMDEIILTR
ncbi:hypothetical protein CEUSTIGMA_g4270.t1 [Chlamydomonas eustigma]|uniref:Purple acid phosphatase n=1 Tax=Chlamydomonas eustigma TaxID=1157962 RepID=A0A250X148_9CHLO|nr:hypothetical protein CEUSTIGMA_g4270.t1 [Chlamydomonas eustigma]|eukprot:GAX76824.1 hypothetical protein CEUSTIGMA_g4270.t1 [Chlamydomonas eustigma]